MITAMKDRIGRGHLFAGRAAIAICAVAAAGSAGAQPVDALLQSRPGITFRAVAHAANPDRAKGITVAKPEGTAANDVMLAVVFVRGAAAAGRVTPVVSTPEGWTLIRRDDHSIEGVPGGGASMLSYYRVAGASEPASTTWTFDTDRWAVAATASYSGVSTTTPVDAHVGGPSTSAYTKTITAPSITTTVANAVVVGFFGLHEGAQAITAAPGMTERFLRTSPEPVAGPRPFGSNLTLEMAEELRASAGATGERVATATFADTWIAQLIALKPAR